MRDAYVRWHERCEIRAENAPSIGGRKTTKPREVSKCVKGIADISTRLGGDEEELIRV